MIEKNEENTDSDNNIVRIRLITDKRTVLEKQFLQVILFIILSISSLTVKCLFNIYVKVMSVVLFLLELQ